MTKKSTDAKQADQTAELTDDLVAEARERVKAALVPKSATADGAHPEDCPCPDHDIDQGLRLLAEALADEQPKGKRDWAALLEKALELFLKFAPLFLKSRPTPAAQ